MTEEGYALDDDILDHPNEDPCSDGYDGEENITAANQLMLLLKE